MKKFLTTILVASGALLAALPAKALVISATTSGANSVDSSAATTGLLAADFDFVSPGASVLDVALEAADVGSPLAFNAVISNLTGRSFQTLRVTLFGGVSFKPFDPARIVEASFAPSADATVNAAATDLLIRFGGAGEPVAAYLGDAFGSASFDDLFIDISGLATGDSFQLQVAVPEPGALGLLGFGALALVTMGAVRRRA